MTSANNNRIAKNTLVLYFRMFLIMGVSLYTSRVVLNILGIADYGLYNVVGGVVAMLGVLNNAMSVSTQRYLTFELGKKDHVRLNQVFSTSMFIYILLALIFLLFAETVGLWFVNTHLVIVPERLEAANWIYQFSIFSSICSVLVNPYNATIIAHERMNVYAYISILEVVLKLAIVYALLIIPVDKLATYGGLIFGVHLLIVLIYRTYSRHHYEECKFEFFWDKKLFKELVSYSGWNLFGSASGLVKSQGINILLNLFFGSVVNASRGIAYQVYTAISHFFVNFYTAVRPQITKYYAEGNIEAMHTLILRSSKFAFFLLLFISMPILLETSYIINLWLKQLPDYVVLFTRLVIINGIIDAMAAPLMTAAHATGKIKLYQSSVGTVTLLNLPISYFILKMGGSPYSVFYVSIVLAIVTFIMRIFIVKHLAGLSIKSFCKDVLLVCFLVTLLAGAIPVVVHFSMNAGLVRFLTVGAVCCMSSGAIIFTLGMKRNERQFLKEIFLKKFGKKGKACQQ